MDGANIKLTHLCRPRKEYEYVYITKENALDFIKEEYKDLLKNGYAEILKQRVGTTKDPWEVIVVVDYGCQAFCYDYYYIKEGYYNKRNYYHDYSVPIWTRYTESRFKKSFEICNNDNTTKS